MQFKPKKSLGQNFLLDKNIRNKIIRACDLGNDDIVLEIGSGRGELTKSLAAGGVKKIYAIEIDTRIIDSLKDNLKDYSNIEVIHQDILEFDFAKFLRKEKKQIKVIGNIPYYITTPIIERLFCYRNRIKDIYLTVQKEFAERVRAPCGSKIYGSLSCFVQYYTNPKIMFVIKKNSFVPPPKVDSVFLKLEVLESPSVKTADEIRLFKIIRAAFNQRRKTLRNSLDGVISREQLDAFFSKFEINPNTRPEDLSLQYFAALNNM